MNQTAAQLIVLSLMAANLAGRTPALAASMEGQTGVQSSAACQSGYTDARHLCEEAAPSAKVKTAPGLEPSAGQIPPEMTVYAVVSKAILAYGGKENLARLDGNFICFGQEKVVSSGVTNEMTFRQVRNGAQLRIELISTDTTAPCCTVYDGVIGWKVNGKLTTDLPGDAVAVLKEDRDRQPFVIAHWGESGYLFRLLGRTAYKQIPVYSIEVSHGDHSATTLFLDQSNYLVVGSSYSRAGVTAGSQMVVDTEYLEYRPVEGAMVPFKLVQSVNGKESLALTLSGAQLHGNCDELLFKRAGEQGAVRLSKAVVVPVEYTQGELIVKVGLNGGEPMEFLLDTGASDSIVDRRVAAEHFLDKQGQLNIVGASGAVATNSSVIRKLGLGAVVLNDVPALILDLSPQSKQLGRGIAGIIGLNVLSQFAVTIDYAKQVIILSDSVDYQVPAGAQTVVLTPQGGLLVKASLHGVDQQQFLMDTGAAFNHLPAVVAGKYLQGAPPHLTEGTGLDGKPVRLGTLIMDTVTIGKLSVSKVNFTYPVGQVGSTGGGFIQSAPVGVLGNPFWRNFIVTINCRSQQLILQALMPGKHSGGVMEDLAAGDRKLIVYRDYRAAELIFQKAFAASVAAGDQKSECRVLGRLGSLHRVLAHDLNRPEQAKVAYQYFNKAQQLARKVGDREGEGRILADWSLLLSDNGQSLAAGQTMQSALLISPNDPFVNVDNAVHLYRAQMYSDMQKYVDKTLFLDPSNWQALWYQVKLSGMYMDTVKQVNTLKEILRFYPWSKLAKEKLTALGG